MKVAQCPRCAKKRFNNSPVSYVWWTVNNYGYMCWHCFAKLKDKT